MLLGLQMKVLDFGIARLAADATAQVGPEARKCEAVVAMEDQVLVGVLNGGTNRLKRLSRSRMEMPPSRQCSVTGLPEKNAAGAKGKAPPAPLLAQPGDLATRERS